MDWAGPAAGRWCSWPSGSARSRKRSSRDSGAARTKTQRGRRRALMSRERKLRGWRGWRVGVLAVCTAWLVVQNLALFALVVWAGPGHALATGAMLARAAFQIGGQLIVLGLATVMALALAAWL